MAYTNSPLVKYTSLSPNHSGQRTHSIDRITPHCVVGQLTAEGICACFPAGREASCNYGIGKDGKIALCVEEKNRSWCSSSSENDQRAITIECASDSTAPYAFNTAVYNALIELCVDICKRNGKNTLLWLGDKTKTLNYSPKSNEMVLTVHRWFANKSCPGDWMYNRMGDLAKTVTERLSGVSGGGSTTLHPLPQKRFTECVRAGLTLRVSSVRSPIWQTLKLWWTRTPTTRSLTKAAMLCTRKAALPPRSPPTLYELLSLTFISAREPVRTMVQTALSSRVSIPSLPKRTVRVLPSGAS